MDKKEKGSIVKNSKLKPGYKFWVKHYNYLTPLSFKNKVLIFLQKKIHFFLYYFRW